jgi:hypothetical protein
VSRHRKRPAPQTITVSPREFIKAWQESSSVAEVAQRIRSKKNACRVRAFRYRQEGVPLKVFPEVIIEPTDWDELSRFAAGLLPDDEARRRAGWVDFDEQDEPCDGDLGDSINNESDAQSEGNSQ